ncbi:MAG: DMT family transporter [Gammaproteobacteria bacterium]
MTALNFFARTLFYSASATGRLLLGALLISFSPVFVKLTSVSPEVSAWYRVAIGGGVLLLWLAARGRLRWPTRGASVALLCAGFFFAADLAAWHQSIVYIGPGLATLLGNFQVFIMAFVGAAFLKEAMSRSMYVAIPLAMLGLVMIAGLDWSGLAPSTRIGILLGLATAAFYSGFMLALRRAQIITGHGDTGSNLAVACLLSAVLLGVFVFARGQTLAIPTLADGLLLVSYALVAQVFGWLLITSALGNVPASRVGLVLLLQPALSFVWDIVFFDRSFTGLELSGALLALVAIFLGSRPAR